MAILNERYECMPRERMREVQLERLRSTVERVYRHVPMYKERFDAIGLKPDDVTSLDALGQIPFTVKTDLRDNYPFGLLACPMDDVVRIHASSGTTGSPTTVGYTREDLDIWSEVVARIVVAGGASKRDVAQISFGYGLFTGALGLHYGLERIGAAVVPVSSGNTERQLKLMLDYGSTVLVSTPSYAMYMSEVAEKIGIDRDRLKLRVGLFGAEGWSEEMRNELERRWGILATTNYGLSEVIGPGVSGECEHKRGAHINEDHFIPEIINPETGEVLPIGEQGELVLTTITKTGQPVIRYRTRDITHLIEEPCPCGRTNVRMSRVRGRSDDMLIIRGINVFPSQIEGVLLRIRALGPNYEIVVRREGYLDSLEVRVEVMDASIIDRFSDLQSLETRIRHDLRTVLQIDAAVKLVEPESLRRFEGKAQRVVDLRKI